MYHFLHLRHYYANKAMFGERGPTALEHDEARYRWRIYARLSGLLQWV